MTNVMNTMRKLVKIFYTGFENIENAFLVACEANNLKKVQECIELGVDVNTKSSDGYWFGLKIAVTENNEELLDLLLSHPNIDVNTRDNYQNTALIVACYKKHSGYRSRFDEARTRACPRSLTIIKRLLDVPDVEVNCKSRDGEWFALKYAASNDDEELLELLLSHPGIDVNNTDNYQNTALMMACYKRYSRIIKRLLAVPDINVNCQNARGVSAFNMAVLRNNEEIWTMLTTLKNINWNEKHPDGESAFTIALRSQRSPIIQTLLSMPNLEINLKELKDHLPSETTVQFLKEFGGYHPEDLAYFRILEVKAKKDF